MKPCKQNRKLIAWLAADVQDTRQTRELRSHLESCEGCRNYLAEISNVTRHLAADPTTPDIQTSEVFHRRVLRAMHTEGVGASYTVIIRRRLRTIGWDWRAALPAFAVIGIAVVLAVTHFRQPAKVVMAAPSVTTSVPKPDAPANLEPTLGHYQMMANRSPEALDELLTRQANITLPPAPIYTASSLALENGLK